MRKPNKPFMNSMDSDKYPINFLVFLFMIISLASSSTSTSVETPTFPIAKSGCEDQDHCANISIPFPFGTREDCYRDLGFFVECLNSSNDTPQLVLGDTAIVVRDISLGGQLRLLYDVGYDCYSNNVSSDHFNTGMSLFQPMVFNTTANKFTAIGCDTYAVVAGTSNERIYTTGCVSECSYKDDVEDGSCSGIGCCQTSIPGGAWEINITLSSYNNHSYVSDFNPCSYGFVIEESAFEFFAQNITDFNTNTSVPVVVDWVVEYVKCEAAKKNLTTYACKTDNSLCYDPDGAQGYRCRCNEGFEGNPYLPDHGCQDINECENSTLNNCPKHSTCVNTVGSYTCNCSEGYNGDGRKDGEGCIADQPPPPPPPPHKKTYGPVFAVVGAGAGSAILVALSFCVYSRLMKRKEDRLREEYFRKNGGLLLQEKIAKQGGSTYAGRIFTVQELQKATNDFDESQIIGQGGFGTVFKGELIDKTIVAIKRSRGVNQHQIEQFINEVIVLSGINNRNVVTLLGCCLETEVPLLVYEFINNGTLFSHLHDKINASNLSWNIRVRIASEVAGVLSYLHSVASPPIIHRDIKSSNILLDQNYTAKVSDFGISRLVPMDDNQVSTVVKGTHGYLDPEYLLTGLLTEKSDVYSFGVVLVELLTGKKVLSSDRPEAERFLSNYFLSSLKGDNLVEVLDHNISYNNGENIEQIKEVAMIAKRCMSVKGEDRPYMKDVARELETLRIKAQPFVVHTFEIQHSRDSEALLGRQSKGYASSDDPTTSCDLYPVSHTTTEQMLYPIAGGR